MGLFGMSNRDLLDANQRCINNAYRRNEAEKDRLGKDEYERRKEKLERSMDAHDRAESKYRSGNFGR